MENSKPVKSPTVGEACDGDGDGSLLNEPMKGSYRSIVASLLYLAIRTRPDLRIADSILGL